MTPSGGRLKCTEIDQNILPDFSETFLLTLIFNSFMPIKNDSDIYNLNDIKPSQLSMHKYKVNALNMLYKIITMTTHSVLSDRESELS